MKRVRLTIEPVEVRLPPVADIYHREGFVTESRGLQWNVSGDPVSLVSLVEGDRSAVTEAFEDHPKILGYETTDVDDDQFLCFARAERTRAAERLFGPYARSDLVVVPPVRYDDVGMHAEVVGDSAGIQGLLDDADDGVRVHVESIRQFADARESILATLSERQREAIEAAHRVGYYDVPRERAHEAVARELGVAPSTASEHLRKAEAKLIDGLLAED